MGSRVLQYTVFARTSHTISYLGRYARAMDTRARNAASQPGHPYGGGVALPHKHVRDRKG